MNFQVIDAQDQTVLETWPTLEQAQQACDEICQRWGEGEAFVKAV